MKAPVRSSVEQSFPQSMVRGYLAFAEQVVRRTAGYLRAVGDLTREGSVEPRLWIGSAEALWSGLIDDFGEAIRAYNPSTGEVPPQALPIYSVDIPEGRNVGKLSIEIPRACFDAVGSGPLGLQVLGLWRGKYRILALDRHLILTPSEVTADARHCRLRVFDLPGGLSSGTVLTGHVLAWPIDPKSTAALFPVAVVQVRIV